ncbi:BREX-1 system adenine-specific DNA-methyltransferase PglX [Stutzerimonas nitrititolerans]|uniref:BREX-1 system adenine-specific DNA-methyltransferase PglX n=1 Tax=Stutzerimonas nitrititolerans TaxID=2482751 RepID=UPI00289DEAE9|nr:BREX-1 system adenine-specific DNA-methyltransferase PglX [Stutzerimonas nitrititolerans]
MNTNAIKRYAPKARTAFIAAMSKRAALLGIRESSVPSFGIAPLEIKGDLALISDSSGTQRAFPASIARPRAALAKKVEQLGFAQTMEQAAYSWFNRLCALRFMEIKGYLDHGRRVLSAADGSAGMPQILEDCLDIELEGLDKARITELKLDGNKDEELYRELLLAQCQSLHQAMPFLFEAVDDALELLLPDNLTKTDSLIRELVAAIPEEDWQDVEIIGWLYQFYISEKKDQVIGKVVKSEDIPAATQLFTPNWIVQYLVQNSLGRQWLQTYPDSPLKAKMPYYIEPAEQTPEVQAQLAAITPESIDPLSLKVLDPACGSGHILVEAYQLLKEIYTERGFRSRDIPQLILENNLFGLDIDDRAGQLARFALMMLAREDDRRIFSRELKLNVLALQESRHLDLDALWRALNLASDWQRGQSQSLFDSEQSNLAAAQADNRYQQLKATLGHFTQAKTFGSLIEVPAEDAQPLGELLQELRQLAAEGDSMQKSAARTLLPYVQQAWILAQRYDAVIANPPYMGMKAMNAQLKGLASSAYSDFKIDTYSMFVERALNLANATGTASLVTMHSWMFLHRFENMRRHLLAEATIQCLGHLGARAFPAISGEVVQTCCFALGRQHVAGYRPVFSRCVDGDEAYKKKMLKSQASRYTRFTAEDFAYISGRILAYWISRDVMSHFHGDSKVGDHASPRHGMVTSDNDRFLRFHWEVSLAKQAHGCPSREAARETLKKWFPYNKGGAARRWYGNAEYLINWENDGREVIGYARELYGSPSRKIQSQEFYFQDGLTWSALGSGDISLRANGPGYLFDSKGSSMFFASEDVKYLMCGLFNSKVAALFISVMSPTLDFSAGSMASMPLADQLEVKLDKHASDCSKRAIGIAKADWDASECSWDFQYLPILTASTNPAPSLASSYISWDTQRRATIAEMKRLEEENNRLFIEAYGLQGELTPDVPLEEITLTSNPHYRYGGEKSDAELETLLQCETIEELVSYAIGCMMGRYSPDKPGLILASQGETLQDYLRQIPAPRFAPDDDAIVPITDQEWFADDATNRFREFIRVVWGDATLQENLDYVAESLCLHAIKPKKGEASLDTIRRYLSTQFFKDHQRTYKKRPIYWLFSSGKHKAFECLVYLHRYNEGTLARMRTEYVIPLTAKLANYAAKLEKDLEASTSTAEKKRLEKELTTLHNQQAELATFDEKLRHYADQRISLDLDDGVKVNYGKFGDLLAEVKAVTGGASE